MTPNGVLRDDLLRSFSYRYLVDAYPKLASLATFPTRGKALCLLLK